MNISHYIIKGKKLNLILSFIKIGMHINGTKYQCQYFNFFNFLYFIIKNNKTKRNMFDILQIFAKIDNNVY